MIDVTCLQCTTSTPELLHLLDSSSVSIRLVAIGCRQMQQVNCLEQQDMWHILREAGTTSEEQVRFGPLPMGSCTQLCHP